MDSSYQSRTGILGNLIVIWIVFSATIFLLSYLIELENGLVLLEHLGINSRSMENFQRLSFWEKHRFILAFCVRLMFLCILLRQVAQHKCRVTEFWLAHKYLAITLTALTIPVLFFVGYMPFLYSIWLMMAYLLGQIQRNVVLALLTLALLLVVGNILNFGRGPIFFGLVSMLIGLQLTKKSVFVFSGFLVLALMGATLAKFETSDTIIGLNIVYRFSALNQLTPYLFSNFVEMNSAIPVSIDLFKNFPVIRGFFGILNEAEIFNVITDGSHGALAIGPEVRALTYWNNYILALVDLVAFYTFTLLLLVGLMKYVPGAGLAIFLFFPSMIQFDTIPVVAMAIQSCIFTSLILLTFYSLRRSSTSQSFSEVAH